MESLVNFEDFQKSWVELSPKKKMELIKLVGSYEVFQERFYHDLPGFIRECFLWNPAKKIQPARYQLLAAEGLQKEKRAAIRTLHGAGKTAFAAWAIWWFILTRDRRKDWKVITTASAWRQLTKYLWPEIHKWHKLIDWKKIGIRPLIRNKHLLDLTVKLETGQASAVASDNHDYIEGAHADSILYVFDEAKAIPDDIFDAAEGAFSTAGADTFGEAFILAISTPGEPFGRFYDLHTKRSQYSDWWVHHIKLDEVVEENRVSMQWVQSRKEQWGEGSVLFQNRVLGEFAQQEEDSMIPLKYIDAAVARWKDTKARPSLLTDQLGLDVARFGDDKTVFAFRSGWVIKDLEKYQGLDTMQTVGKAMGFSNRNKSMKIKVDVIGIGAGVFDRLKEQGRKVVAFNAAGKTDRLDKSKEFGFVNIRSAAWWNLRELLMEEDSKIALPDDPGLIGDLSAPKWKVTSSGKIQVESKEEIKKRIGKSTDEGDAVVQVFWDERTPSIVI